MSSLIPPNSLQIRRRSVRNANFVDRPDDSVVGTGEMYTVREFTEIAFDHVSLRWSDCVVEDPSLFRPADMKELQGVKGVGLGTHAAFSRSGDSHGG
jgi:hypothetical protein